ncbi:hypothetical protein PHPALM_27845 [Phytophthora palmivora]|uniref:Tc3 transposase DNA binding domain-containing protein n=1 Tax=Phytophthora palmivora TaxID=4796 RepID=A0A2P4XBL3_9STRA|nr:hypothetical protein PHPALM_27845 [Phytophthora palmivora]
MGQRKALTNQEYWWIIGLHDDGISLGEISRKTGRSRTCIRKAITVERRQQIDSGSEVPRGRRQPALTEREVWGEVAAEFKTDLDIKASMRTVQRLLKRVDHLVYAEMGRTLSLTATHKAARISWAEEHILNPVAPSMRPYEKKSQDIIRKECSLREIKVNTRTSKGDRIKCLRCWRGSRSFGCDSTGRRKHSMDQKLLVPPSECCDVKGYGDKPN